MRFRAGLVLGFGVGYYAGAMAGRERYEQINRLAGKVKRSDTFDTATGKARAAVDLGVERVRDIVDDKLSGEPGSTKSVVGGPLAPVPAGSDGGANGSTF